VIHCPSPASASGPPPIFPLASDFETIALVVFAALASTFFATLRASLLYAHTPRVLAHLSSEAARERMLRLLGQVERWSTSAAIGEIACQMMLLAALLGLFAGEQGSGWGPLGLALATAVPILLFSHEVLSTACARRFGDSILLRVLPAFALLQLPVQVLVIGIEWSRRRLLRVLGVPAGSRSERDLVEGLREVIQDTGRDSDLDDSERELIENVMEFRDVDVAAVMTPRTEIDGIDLCDGFAGAVRGAAESGHSRIPVYEDSLDNIVGYISALDVVKVLADGGGDGTDLRPHLRPAFFVPETKQISSLLSEFRRERQKMAIVLDEYGGTAGLVTLGDVLEEIVGEIQDEFDAPEPTPFREVEPGQAVVDASLHVSELNELFETNLPEEEDFETVAGFVLSELGHFPKRGESFDHDGVQYEVLEASDRRVIQIQVCKLEHGQKP
jgi:CBS domain containing-hemolysin-like protein